ncbi:hypothetical protein Tco_0617205 [Tanacetum coccineum]
MVLNFIHLFVMLQIGDKSLPFLVESCKKLHIGLASLQLQELLGESSVAGTAGVVTIDGVKDLKSTSRKASAPFGLVSTCIVNTLIAIVHHRPVAGKEAIVDDPLNLLPLFL